jgi:periodic tryptophan protein 2
VVTDLKIFIYLAPSLNKTYETLTLFKKFTGKHQQKILAATWSPDSKFLVSYSKDLTVIMHSLYEIPKFVPFTFVSNKAPLCNAFFNEKMTYFYTIDNQGAICVWKWVEDYLSEEYLSYKNRLLEKGRKKLKL